jgi:uncharacterized protein (TIGR03435 family)
MFEFGIRDPTDKQLGAPHEAKMIHALWPKHRKWHHSPTGRFRAYNGLIAVQLVVGGVRAWVGEILLRLNFGKILLLATAGLLSALSGPLIVGMARAQTTVPAFEVVSVKIVPASQGLPIGFSHGPRRSVGRFTWTTTLDYLSRYAYRLPSWRISGIEQARFFYTIEATLDSVATEDQVRQMVQAVLVERFKFVTHRETKELSGYNLVVGKKGPKLNTKTETGEVPPMPDYLGGKPSAAFEGRIFTSMEGLGTAAITGRGVSMAQFADELSQEMGVFVSDQTGLNGQYYFGLRFASIQNPREQAEGLPVFAAVADLGLKLEKKKGPVEILVIDHFEKPSEN